MDRASRDIGLPSLLFEQEACTLDAVIKWKTPHFEGVVFVELSGLCAEVVVKNHFEIEAHLPHGLLGFEKHFQSVRGMHIQRFGSSEQVHGGDEAVESEEVVSVQMRDEDVVDALHLHLVASQLHLGAFTAIDQEVLVMDVHYLSGRMVTHCVQCCATAEYGDFEFHNKKNRSKVERLTLDFVESLSVDDHAFGKALAIHVDAVQVEAGLKVGDIEA